MPMLRPLAAALAALTLAPAVLADGQHRREQDEVYAARVSGQVMSLRQIEQKVVPRMSGFDYLGPEFDPGTAIYRLKFMRAGSVVWIDVDGRNGAIIGRTGN
ncbi:hypothetical protein Q4F19_02955 [Sphingomonas sp. BIUV-7]|uniref:PepSY domain-containing protein n=1 Tax=Sphingomonas natans TaxID=3063330 RepID=A0ABT8Y4U1_9SPHN|nr:hypothetical protein [Sphingomonas sp. BIUV-7]MDO6413331.1 hypothetical protein [Sphingomonas sp. BIUV-7]